MSLLGGVLAAFGAAALYSVGISLQAVEARAAPRDHHLRFLLLRRLVRRPRWIAGTAAGLLGWGLQAVALLFAPLTLVQPALAATLIFLLAFGAVLLNEHVGLPELAAVLAICAGVALLGWSAPARESRHAGATTLAVALGLLGAASLAPYASRHARRRLPLLVPISAGLAYSLDGLATKLASDDFAQRVWLGAALWFALMNAASGVGTLSEMSALQERPVTQVAPIVFVLNTLVPVALAPALAREGWPSEPGREAAIVFSLVLIVAGARALVRAPAVEEFLAGTARSSDSETPRRWRSWRSAATRRATARGSADG